MNIFLTSVGLVTKNIKELFLGKLRKAPSESKVLIIAYALAQKHINYVEEVKREMQNLGFVDISFLNLNDNVDLKTTDIFDVVYVCGGNTFSILQKLKEKKVDKIIIDLIKNGAIYVGVSAGGIIAGPNIEIAGWGSEGDNNNVGLSDLSGLGLTDISIFPHFKKSLQDEVDEFRKKVSYPVIELTDEHAVIVDESDYKIIVG